MFLLLQSVHYDLAVPLESIGTKYLQQKEIDIYEPEEEEDDEPNDEPKTAEEKLADMESKYTNIKNKYFRCIDKIKKLECKLNKENTELKTNKAVDNSSDSDEDLQNLLKSKSKGFRNTLKVGQKKCWNVPYAENFWPAE